MKNMNFRILTVWDYYDGPLSGVCSYMNKMYWYNSDMSYKEEYNGLYENKRTYQLRDVGWLRIRWMLFANALFDLCKQNRWLIKYWYSTLRYMFYFNQLKKPISYIISV